MSHEKPTMGGKREGAGRPKKKRGEKSVSVTVSLPPDAAARMQRLGGSARAAIDLAAIRRGILAALNQCQPR